VAPEPLVYTYTNFFTITFSNQGLLAKEAAYKLLHTLAFRAGGMGVATALLRLCNKAAELRYKLVSKDKRPLINRVSSFLVCMC
jgi:hypothetical protein